MILTGSQKEKVEQYFKAKSITGLALLFSDIFGKDLNIKCSSCIFDAEQLLKRLMAKQETPCKYEWVGQPNATVNIKTPEGNYSVGKHNLNDKYAEMVLGIAKYAHNVRLKATEVKPVEEKKTVVVESLSESEATTSILTEAQSVEKVAKKRGRKPKLK